MPGRPKARRYAQAVFELAIEHDAVDQWTADLDRVAQAAGSEDFAALLEAPQVPAGVKHQGIETVLSDAQRLARNLLSVLVEHGQPRLAGAIRNEFRALVDAHRGIARANVETAVPLDDEQRDRVRKLLGELVGAQVIIIERVDPRIIGGVIARVGDRLIDGSTRTRLRALRATLALAPADEASESSRGA